MQMNNTGEQKNKTNKKKSESEAIKQFVTKIDLNQNGSNRVT